MNRIIICLLALSTVFISCKDEHQDLKDGLYAELETSKGNILLELNYEKTPVTVANFVTLAEGKNPFVSKEYKGKPLYDEITFHRVISKNNGDKEDFMIQTGDPLGNGAGDAGYTFIDEITDLQHDKPGILSMANSGPSTNSCQFFITHVPTPWLDGKHTVFGEVVDEESQKVVNAITQNDMLHKVTIIRKGEAAKKFNAVKVFSDYFKKADEKRKKQLANEEADRKAHHEKYNVVIDQKLVELAEIKQKASTTSSGLQYTVTQKSNGKKPEKDSLIFISYSGFLEDGTLFDTSNPEVAKIFGTYDELRAKQNGYNALPYKMGSKNLIPGFVEGVSKLNIGEKAVLFIPAKLGYGEQGAGNVIPPNANLIFEIEIKDKN